MFPASAQHPLLFDHPASGTARIMLIGASPGPGGDPARDGVRAYLRENNNESPLGWFSGYTQTQWLAKVFWALPKPRDTLGVSQTTIKQARDRVTTAWRRRNVSDKAGAELDRAIRGFRSLVPIHATNVVKCHTSASDGTRPWIALAAACTQRYLRREIAQLAGGTVVILLGRPATDYVSGLLGLDDSLWRWWDHSPYTMEDHRILVGGHRLWFFPFRHPGRPASNNDVDRLAVTVSKVLRGPL